MEMQPWCTNINAALYCTFFPTFLQYMQKDLQQKTGREAVNPYDT